MKKITLLLFLLIANLGINAQVKFYINGCNEYDLTWPDSDFWLGTPGSQQSWSTPNMLLPSNAVNSQMVLVEGIDPVTHGNCTMDMACNGVANITNSAALTGKIAVIRRGSCEFGSKALAAQDAGAIACIIINAVGSPINMAGGTNGLSVTIPTIMVSESAGYAICDAINSGTANAFIGNNVGYYANNLSVNKHEIYQHNRATDVAKVYNATNGTGVDHTYTPGVLVRNLGTNNQINVQVTCQITLNAASVYNQTSTAFNLVSGDSLWVNFPNFINTTETNATYEVSYSVSSSSADDFNCDNNIGTSFTIVPNKFSYARTDQNTGKPMANSGYFVSNGNVTDSVKVCNHFYDANAQYLYPESISFQAYSYDPVNVTTLTGRSVNVEVIEWTANNGIYDLTDPSFDQSMLNNNFNSLSSGFFYYLGDWQDSLITVQFNSPINLLNNTHYLFCISYDVNTANNSFSLRFDNTTDYTSNFGDSGNSPQINNGYPTTSVIVDNNFFSAGNGLNSPSSMVVNFADCIFAVGTDVVTSCGAYTWIDGNTYTSSTTNPTYTYVNGATNGCDSIVHLDLTIDPNLAPYSTDSITSCGSIVWIDGNTYSTTNNTATYTYVGGAASGCDSIVYLNLTIDPNFQPTTTIVNGTIQANPSTAASYQWIDCNNNTAIAGETSNTFTPTANGNYAVFIPGSNCVDTSDCVLIDFIGLNNINEGDFKLYPNPTNDNFYIQSNTKGQLDVSIINLQGKIVYHKNVNPNSPIDVSLFSQGVYFIQIKTNNSYKTIKLVIEH